MQNNLKSEIQTVLLKIEEAEARIKEVQAVYSAELEDLLILKEILKEQNSHEDTRSSVS